MITKQRVLKDVRQWFSTNPPYPDGEFLGVIVFERTSKKKLTVNRLGVAADLLFKIRWDMYGRNMTMPFTSQPSEEWKCAKAIGFATTCEEAIELLFPTAQVTP